MLGGFVAFLSGRPKGSKKTIILELIIIGIPSILMTFIVLIYYNVPAIYRVLTSEFIGNNLIEITSIGELLLGCEVYRLIYGIRKMR